jgi:hypothetical protein
MVDVSAFIVPVTARNPLSGDFFCRLGDSL